MPLPLPPTPGCPPGDWSFGGETGELGEAASRCSAPEDTSTRAGDPQLEPTSHISGWLWPWGYGFGLQVPALSCVLCI